jgi:outer membrane protein assembly factor BamD
VKQQLKIIATVLTVVMLAGCPSLWQTDTVVKNASADELYRQAEDLYQKKDYVRAVEVLENLKSGHPDFKKMAEVHLKIADGLFNNGAYDKAVARYSVFTELFPGNKEVPRAKYYTALAYFNQIKPTDRDSTAILGAANALKALVEDPQAGEWGKKADEKLQECRKMLAEKEWEKARTYVSMGKYQSARIAAKRVLDEYPKLGFDAQANEMLQSLKNK